MKRSKEWFSVQMMGVLLLLVAIVTGTLGYLNLHNDLILPKPLEHFVADFYANTTVELISIGITVLIIDQLYERSRSKQIKEQLIRQMGANDNGLALVAVDELRAYGWLEDGSLRKVSFYSANLMNARLFSADLEETDFERADLGNADLKWVNLRNANLKAAFLENSLLIGACLSKTCLSKANLGGAYLIGADLREADLEGAILTCAVLWNTALRGARVTEAQLRKAIMLYGTIMPDGNVYDGRFKLKGDIALASETRAVDDVSFAQDEVELPEVARSYASQFLRWKWVSEQVSSWCSEPRASGSAAYAKSQH